MPRAIRHTNELLLRLEQVADRGHAEITDKELRRWYRNERIASGIWQDIDEHWADIFDQKPDRPKLLARGIGYGYALIRGDDLVPVETRAKRGKHTPTGYDQDENATE